MHWGGVPCTSTLIGGKTDKVAGCCWSFDLSSFHSHWFPETFPQNLALFMDVRAKQKTHQRFHSFFTKCAQKNPVSKQRLQSLLDVCRPLKHWTSLELNLSTAERLMKLLAKQNGPLLARLERVQVGLVVSVFGLWRFLTQQRQKPCLCRYILEKLHTDSGQMLSRDKDPKEPTRITGCNKGFFTSQLVGL